MANFPRICSKKWRRPPVKSSDITDLVKRHAATPCALICLTVLWVGARATAQDNYQEPFPALAMVHVPAGSFEMGRSGGGTDAEGASDELPRHEVYLSDYDIGLYEVTNAEYAAVLNWAAREGALGQHSGQNVVLNGHLLLEMTNGNCQIDWPENRFTLRSSQGKAMDFHPVVMVSWYGAVAFCNWLSQIHGLDPCYNLETWERIHPLSNGYRLPTEAEWERAAGWSTVNGGQHQVYAFSSDRIDFSWCNCRNERTSIYANPLGLPPPRTAPAGYYKGTGSRNTRSPAGCFDMSGNVWEWCHDRYATNYYAQSPRRNPAGPGEGSERVERGGSWNSGRSYCRTAKRNRDRPDFAFNDLGFRVARSQGRGIP